ncbi:MAG: MG2 domain-containing protein [Bacteroidetes bacterium]|nr:MG2 domain-containing protein [Bacteroidota bacterium]
MKKRTIQIAATVITVVVFAFVVYKIATQKHHFKRVNPAFKEYVQAFTSGVVSTHTTVKIRLTNDYADSSLFGMPISEKLFSFKPAIQGKATWIDSRTIEFRPESKLPPKKFYEAEFYLSKLIKVPDSIKTLEFQFQTMQQDYEITVENHKAYNKAVLSCEKLYGTLHTADIAEDVQIEKVLTAVQDNKQLKVSWVHDAQKKVHYFQVDSIKRGNKKSFVTLTYKGKPIEAKTKGEKAIEIPALGDFKLLNVRLVQGTEQYILAQFSDPLLENQNLEGLIKLAKSMDLRYAIEDNELRIYPPIKKTGEATLSIESTVRNINGDNLGISVNEDITFEDTKPNIRFIGNGVIMPSSNGLMLPFEAVNLKAVDIKITKIYENNIVQFLQVNDLSGQRELARVGKTVLKKTIPLNNVTDYGKWNRFSIDLSHLIKTEPGAIYTVRLSFKKDYSSYPCEGVSDIKQEVDLVTWNDDNEREDGWYYENEYYDDYYDEDGYYYYNWDEREDPCKKSYYNDKAITRNVLASDLGIIAKAGNSGNINVYVTNLVDTKPVSNVSIEFYDYQQQLLGTVKTNDDGMAEIKLKRRPFVLIAKKDEQRAYLKMIEGSSLSLSMFDVSGEAVQKGLKGFIYGERGVWRPGDSLYLTFILEDKEKRLPENHPVSFDLVNPNGQVVRRMIRTASVNGFYDFRTATERNAPTGNWQAKIKVGGVEFQKNLKIETVKPNRLKINFGFGKEYIAKNDKTKGMLEAHWLTGATARNLKATVNLTLTKTSTVFKKYPNYIFDNPTSGFSSENITIFNGNLDETGKATVNPDINISTAAPGMLKANFETTVFEAGGDFSVDRFTLPYYPYQSYAGVSVPQNPNNDRMLYTDKAYSINLLNLDFNGNIVPSNKLKVELYKIEWRWWWDNSESGSQADFISTSYSQLRDTATIATTGGRATYKLNVPRDNWGRYLIKVTDQKSGHSCGKVVYIDWYGYTRTPNGEKQAATMLTFTADKEKYNVGEKVKISIPTSANGRALLTLETGSKVLKSFWIPTKQGNTDFVFDVTEDMAPNCYAYVTLIQPHAQTVNDLPIRLYGVIPILVENPNTHLYPVITMKDVLLPEQNASITVKEQKGKPMTYTLAIVDEGLLDLTRFKTPNPWLAFYAREALGIKTWDLFDLVMGAYTGELQRILSIGGDGEGLNKGSLKANRFIPMVKFLGPFQLAKGQSKTHTFKMPQYIGSVRVMVVAGDNGNYGCAEKAVAVRKPLMVLGTLPRVVGPGETVKLPVSVFAMEKSVRNVNVQIVTDNMFTIIGGNSRSLTFKNPGDEMLNFELKVKELIGVGKIKIIASSGNQKAVHEIEIDIRNPNPKVTDVVESIIEGGKTWNANYQLIGMQGTNKAVLEVSSVPPLNLEKRLDYLIAYPHGCIEQTTSSVFPQLYLADLVDLTTNQKQRIEQNIKAAIQKLKSFQLNNGGLGYWQGAEYADDWGSNYAGHFLLEAELKGYQLPIGFITAWKKYQKQKAVSWAVNATYYNDDLVQAYRLYTLALAKSPELGAMNKLYEYKNLSLAARWQLAAAYQLVGKSEVAKALIANANIYIKPYRELWYTYGSDVRDKAMIVQTLCLMNQKAKSAPLVREISSLLCKEYWMSTQETAYSLLAVSRFIGSSSGSGVNITYNNDGGQNINIQSKKAIAKAEISIKQNIKKGKVQLTNNGKNVLYARIITQGIPATGDNTSVQNNLRMTVEYKSMSGVRINPAKSEQGTNFVVEVTVSNPGFRGVYKQLALTQIFPSGWEIFNARMSEMAKSNTNASYFTYQDIRDDRVYTYFDLNPNQSKSFKIMLNPSYLGKFYLPTISCEAMYDNTINARIAGNWVEVVNSGK